MKVIRRNGSCRQKRRNWALATENPCNHRKLHVLIITKSEGCIKHPHLLQQFISFNLQPELPEKTFNQRQNAAVSVCVCVCACKCLFREKSIFRRLSKNKSLNSYSVIDLSFMFQCYSLGPLQWLAKHQNGKPVISGNFFSYCKGFKVPL